ncbi:hypothetical protein RA280_07660 [Cupriavidus sp. CV2]|uniref:hypothetical protein n=1 Tax=Cupriavidus ulmosensis TaxID=3065913 RepID=UPI00296B20B3|nr:hypothetical protein [Cupriavidus sp. CV2]MDW3681625.1 hypothetical protein [Cupriavidus sp. CV2]
MQAIPSYAVDLLIAAKAVAAPPINAIPEALEQALQHLSHAVGAFEAATQVASDGTIAEYPSATGA